MKPIPFERACQDAHAGVFHAACIASGRGASGGGLLAAARVGAIGGDEVCDTSDRAQHARFSTGKSLFCPCVNRACTPGDEFGGRESIFRICHTNEFSGWSVLASEPTTACCGVIRCRRDYERGKRKSRKQFRLSGL
jgi:hypothetical protein